MNQIRLLTLTLFSGILISVALYFYEHRSRQVADADYFHLDASATVDHIQLTGGGRTLDLNFNGTSWRVNDQYPADQEKIKILFAAVNRAVPKRKVRDQSDSVQQLFGQSLVTIKFFEGTSMIRSFEAAGNARKNETYFRDDQAADIFQMNIPGYRTYLFTLFDTAPEIWRELRIFDFNWRNFSGMDVQFTAHPNENFEVALQDGFFSIKGLTATDTTRLNSYLDAVSLLKADRFISTQPADSLHNISPGVILKVKEVSGSIHELRLLPGNLALLNQKDYIGLNDRKLRLLMAGRSAFTRK